MTTTDSTTTPAQAPGTVPAPVLPEPLACGTQTQWGEIAAVGIITGERYYWMLNAAGVVSMMPADVVEQNDKADFYERSEAE